MTPTRSECRTIRAMRVAIVGAPGIGKSTLLRQLGDLYHNGSYGEGEEGVWDPRVLQDIEAGRNAVGVTAYFAWLYDANYRERRGSHRRDRPVDIIKTGAVAKVSENPEGTGERRRNRKVVRVKGEG